MAIKLEASTAKICVVSHVQSNVLYCTNLKTSVFLMQSIKLNSGSSFVFLAGAFFDMYIGDLPVCEQTKKEIGMNVANMIKRC